MTEFVIWMLCWPLVSGVRRYIDFRMDVWSRTGIGAVGDIVDYAVWIGVAALLLFKGW